MFKMPLLTLIETSSGLKLRIDGCNGPLVISEDDEDPCCCDPCAYVLCISVIDEDSNYDANGGAARDGDWSSFRAAWPERKFFLLRPNTESRVGLPAGWDGTGPIQVNRDEGNSGNASDWYTLCNLDENLAKGGKIALFVDNSGSMTTATVQASYDLFRTKLAARIKNDEPDPVTIENDRLIPVIDRSERWIRPHISFEDCPSETSVPAL